MNNFNGIGRLTRDIELRKTGTGKSVANFTIAINKYNDEVDFINCVAWEKVADVLANYTQKGSQIGVSGSITTGSYDHKDGYKVNTTEITAHSIDLLDSKPSGDSQPKKEYVKPTQSKQETKEEPVLDITSDDLPF